MFAVFIYFRFFAYLLSIPPILLLSFPALAQRNCSAKIWIGLGAVSNDTMTVRQGFGCAVGTMAGFKMKEVFVVVKPQHGRIEMTNSGLGVWRYVASKSYVGPDTFRVKVSGILIDRTGAEGSVASYEQLFRVEVVQ
jgi:hypothetical protein